MVQVINVCAALHNLCVENNISLDEEIVADDQQGSHQDSTFRNNNFSSIANNIRDELKQLFL